VFNFFLPATTSMGIGIPARFIIVNTSWLGLVVQVYMFLTAGPPSDQQQPSMATAAAAPALARLAHEKSL
jgi:hypothetical protein